MQEQLSALNQGSSKEAPTLSEYIAWELQQLSAESLPIAPGEWQGSVNSGPKVLDEQMNNNSIPMAIRGRGGTSHYKPGADNKDTNSNWSPVEGGTPPHHSVWGTNSGYVHYVNDLVLPT